MGVPSHQRHQVAQVNKVVHHLALHTPVNAGGVRHAAAPAPALENQAVRFELIFSIDRPGGDDRAKGNPAGAHQTALSAQENWRLIQHDAIRDVTDQ